MSRAVGARTASVFFVRRAACARAAACHQPSTAAPRRPCRSCVSPHPPPSPLLAATVNLNLLEREEIFVKAFQQMDKVGGWGGWVGGRACGSGATVADMQAGCASLPSPRPPANVSCTPSTVRGAQALPSPARPTTTQPARAQDGSGTLSADEVAEAVGATGRMRESEAKDLIARHAWGGGCWVCEWCGGGCRVEAG